MFHHPVALPVYPNMPRGSLNLPQLHKYFPNRLIHVEAEFCCYVNCCAHRGLQPAPATTREEAEQLLISYTAI